MSFSETALCYALTFIVLSTTFLLFIIPDYDGNPFFRPFFLSDSFPVYTGDSSDKAWGGRSELGAFLEKGVSQLTGSGYTKRFEVFTSFVRTKIGIDDPFMLTLIDTKKTEMVANYIKQQYEEGSRGKKAHSDTAAIRHYFTCGGHGVDFLGTERDPHPVLQKARLACKMSSEEMRVEKRKGKSSVKIALPDSIMTTMKEKYWDMYTWETKEGAGLWQRRSG